MHNQDLLDNAPQVPSAWLHPQGKVLPGRARGAGPSQPEQTSHIPEAQKALLIPQAHGHGLGVH